ncbi:thioester-containing protein 1 allele S3-like isoform X2 [Paramacrobiotus metropolitanus]|uniref:thioester-containing protein 1 allele S3-like isoform X2 n=1 Tax=Paramacrobiotus metropolitanus TaxID=2943436 RepID=UPI0024459F2F|nr:thioester-containing protein 1 allele S3-like isoform X2 [Paramacrobiotus metropolitanus]
MLYEEKKRTSVALANMQSLVFLQLALSVFVACSAKYAFADGVEQGAVIVYHSRFLRPNNIFEITISSSYSTDVEVQAIIKGGDGDFGDAKLSISPGERRILKIQVDDLAVTNRYRLELADSLCDTAKTSELDLLVNESLVLIQLDKPVYRPADIINYRVLVLNAELRLDQTVDTVDVRLLNPAEKEVDVQRNQKAKYEAYPGYFEGFFGLPNLDPDVGRWTVEVAGKHIGIATKSLSVEEYQLPLFRLDVIAPESFVVAKQANLRLTFQIINNIGIPVSGTVKVTLTDSLNLQPKQLGFAKIDGSSTEDYELNLSQLEMEYCQIKKNTKPFLTLTITATETQSRKSVEVRKDLAFYCNAFKMVAVMPQEFFQPGAWNNATVKVMKHDGSKVYFRARNIWTQGQFAGREVTHNTEHEDDRSSDFVIGKIVAVDEDTVVVPFKSSSAATSVTLSVNIGEVREEITFYARGGHAELHMNEPGRKYRVGNDVKFSLQCTQNCKHMEYSVVSRKGILLTKNVSMTNENSGELTFMVTSDMAPASRIVAYYLKDADLYSTGGVFLVDETSTLATVHLHVTPVDRSRDHVLPGQMARIRVGAPPNSLVGFLALDKTVLQLQHGSGNDITAFEVAEKYRSWSRPAPALVDSAKCEDEQTIQQCYDEKQTAYFSKSNLAVHVLRADCPEDSSQFARVPVQLRTNFRDSFLFITNFTDTNGFVTFRTSVPDSVTTWSITAFAANTNYSLALVKAPVELKVCQDFYISMELPASLIENESGYVNVTLFYVRDQAVAMSFNVEIGATAVFHRHLERSSLRAQHFRFPLGPFKKSVQKVTASLYLFDGAKYGLVDQIQKVVKVIHSGVVEYRNSDVINVTRGTVEIPVDNFDVEREGSVVPESSSCLLHLYADPFGMPVQDFSVGEKTGPSSKFYHSSAEPVISRFMANVLFMKFWKHFALRIQFEINQTKRLLTRKRSMSSYVIYKLITKI